MIHTLTLNPSVDVTFVVDRIDLGEAQRLPDPVEYAGGKGMNVSVALHALGLPSIAWVCIGGDRGERWRRLAQRQDVPLEVIAISGETRQNIKIFERHRSRTTDLNLPGPSFDPAACNFLLTHLASHLRKGDYVVLAGSAPPNTPDFWWNDLAQAIEMARSHLIVDTSGDELQALASRHPWALKINREEYNRLNDRDHTCLEAIFEELADSPPDRTHLILTDGEQGTLACPATGKPIRVQGLAAKVRGTVGAGDAFTAGFLTGWIERQDDWMAALKMGIAAATAAVESPGTTFGSREAVLEKLERF
jgi:6-phosphofructokinase 2